MKRGANSSRTEYYDDAPNEKNQPQHSPAHSSSVTMPNPPYINADDMLGILVPTYLNLPTAEERNQQAIEAAQRRHTRPRPNDGVFQFGTPPGTAVNTSRTGPHLTPSGLRQPKVSLFSSDTDLDVVSACHYLNMPKAKGKCLT